MQRERAVVMGGGVVGLASALALARAGWSVDVHDGDEARAAPSWNNAGHIAVEQVDPLASIAAIRSVPRRLFLRGGALGLPPGAWREWLPFAARLVRAAGPARFAAGRQALSGLLAEALPAWRRLAGSLPAPGLLREDGHLLVWHGDAAAKAGRAAWAAADTGTASITPIPARQRAELARLMSVAPTDGLSFTGSAQITDLAALAAALEEALTAAGGRIVRRAAALSVVEGTALVDGMPADLVVVAAGIGSRRLMQAIGHRVPMIAERGYHIRSVDHDWPADLPPLVFEDRSMIVTRYAECVQAASFTEFAPADATADPRKWQRLERHVVQLGLPIRGPFTRWMGARPTLPDYLPAIGRSRRADNLVYAFGHQHLGLTLAAITGELVAALATGETSAVPIDAFDLARFAKDKA